MVPLYSWRTGVLVPYFKDIGEGGVLYIVGGQGSLSHFLRIKIIDPVFLGVSWEKEKVCNKLGIILGVI